MLTIIKDPAGVTGSERHEWDYSISIQGNIERHLPGGFGCVLMINGVHVDPSTDPRMDLPPTAMDCATVVMRPEGFDPVTLLYIALAAVAVAAYTMIPKVGSGSSAGKDSPNNSLTAQTNIARTYQAIPDVYGLRRVYPDLIQASMAEYINHIKYVTEWMCVSRGKGTITNVQYAETPIDDIDGASYSVFEPVSSGYPEDGSTTLSNVYETFATEEVNGQELAYADDYASVTLTGYFSWVSGESSFVMRLDDTSGQDWILTSSSAKLDDVWGLSISLTEYPITSISVSGGYWYVTMTAPDAFTSDRSGSSESFTLRRPGLELFPIGPFTLPVSADRLRWNTVFLRGLRGTVYIHAEWWKVDSSGAEISGTRESVTNGYYAKTYDQRFWTNEVTPAAGHGIYRMQFWRTNKQVNDSGADVAKLENVYAVRYYATKTLPGVTVIKVTTKATTEATGYSERKFNLWFARHVRTLTTGTISASRNFARIMAHIWTLAGRSMSGLDVDAMQSINDQFGENSPLLRFDGSLDDEDMSLGERLQLVAGTCRGVVWRDGLKWTITREQAKDYPDIQLDYRNLASGSDSTISYASHLPDSNDGVEVEYVDEEKQSKKAYIRLTVASGSVVSGSAGNPKKVKMPGCATWEQANNRAQLEARRLLYQRTSVKDTALSDGALIGIGTLVRWIDPNDFYADDGLQAGEVLSISGSVITTSEKLQWGSETSGRIIFTGIDGRRLGAPIVCTRVDDARMSLASVPPGLFTSDGARQCGSRYAFAVGLTDSELESAGLYVCTQNKPNGDGTFSLGLAQYDARMFEED